MSNLKGSTSRTPETPRWHYGDINDRNFQISGRILILVMVVLSFFFLLILLFLYMKWAYRYRNVVPASAQPVARQCGLDREAIDAIPVKLQEAAEEEAECSICLSVLEEGEKVKVLPGCEHGFHPDCVDAWLIAQPTCPLCRASLEGGGSVV